MDYMAQTKRLWPLAMRCDLPFLSQCDRHRQGSCGISGISEPCSVKCRKAFGQFLVHARSFMHMQFGFIWPHRPCAHAVWVYLTTRTVCRCSLGLFDHTDRVHAQFGFIWPHGPCARAVCALVRATLRARLASFMLVEGLLQMLRVSLLGWCQ